MWNLLLLYLLYQFPHISQNHNDQFISSHGYIDVKKIYISFIISYSEALTENYAVIPPN